jgi:undecaprenyl-diphosphatase
MLDKLLSLDSRLLVYLNGLGSETYDGLWLMITKQQYWTPFFYYCYTLYLKNWNQTIPVRTFITLILVFTDQVTNLFKMVFSLKALQ